MRILSPSAFEMSWRVTGPQKNYEIVTHFARIEIEEEEEPASDANTASTATAAADNGMKVATAK